MAYPNPYGGGYSTSSGYPYPIPSFPPAGGYALPSYPGMYPGSVPKSYFIIKSNLTGQVLDVEGGNTCAGARVITWPLKGWGDWHNQLWYDDPMTGTIRAKTTGYCLDISGDTLVVNPHYPGNGNQLWERYGSTIRNRHVLHRVLDISGANRSKGAKIIVWDQSGAINQQFEFLYVPGLTEPYTRRDFVIVSELNGKVLDINGGNPAAGAGLIMWPKKSPPSRNQLWYFDSQGVIHSALNDLVLESHGGTQVRMMPFNYQNYQQWTVVGNRILNKTGECLDIRGAQQRDGAEIISYGYKGSANQHWRLEFM